MMRRFRHYPQIGGKRGGIPSGWVELDYVESTGTQYIKTGFLPDNTCGIKVDAEALFVRDTVVVGCRRINSERWWVNFGGSAINASWGSFVNTSYSYGQGIRRIIENNFKNSRSFVIDGVVVNTSLYSTPLPDSNREAYIFGANDGGTFRLSNSFRVYSCQLSRGNIIERDFVGIRNASTNEVAMCDILTGDIYRNQGTGAFIAGPDKREWVNPYITDGLIAMWDGEWNAGGGLHEANPASWKDCVGERDLTWPSSQFSVGKDFVYFGDAATTNAAATRPFDDLYDLVKDGYTVETVVRKVSGKGLADIAEASGSASYIGFMSRYSGPFGVELIYSYWSLYKQIRGSYGSLTQTSPVFVEIDTSDVITMTQTCDANAYGYGLNGSTRRTTAGTATPVGALRGAARFDTLFVGAGGGQVGYAKNTPFMEICCCRLYGRSITEAEQAANRSVDVERFKRV